MYLLVCVSSQYIFRAGLCVCGGVQVLDVTVKLKQFQL